MIPVRKPEIAPNWTDVVRKIRRGDDAGVADCCRAVTEAAHPSLRRALDPESVDDRLHEIVVIVLEAIRDGHLRDPNRIMGFVRTVTQRLVVAHIRSAVYQRRR